MSKIILFIKKRLRPGDGLRLGDLSGNRFKLVIREIDEKNDQIIQNGIESLKTNGFINYFGLQRFGTCNEAPTHIIGSKLIIIMKQIYFILIYLFIIILKNI